MFLYLGMYKHVRGLGYCTGNKHDMYKIQYGKLIISKGSNMCRFFILDSSTIISHAPLCSQNVLDKTKQTFKPMEH